MRLAEFMQVLEISPSIKWDKGKALKFLLKSLGYANSDDVVPIYIGDDRTDEDAFKVTIPFLFLLRYSASRSRDRFNLHSRKIVAVPKIVTVIVGLVVENLIRC